MVVNKLINSVIGINYDIRDDGTSPVVKCVSYYLLFN